MNPSIKTVHFLFQIIERRTYIQKDLLAVIHKPSVTDNDLAWMLNGMGIPDNAIRELIEGNLTSQYPYGRGAMAKIGWQLRVVELGRAFKIGKGWLQIKTMKEMYKPTMIITKKQAQAEKSKAKAEADLKPKERWPSIPEPTNLR